MNIYLSILNIILDILKNNLLPLQEVLHRVLKDVDNGNYDVLFR